MFNFTVGKGLFSIKNCVFYPQELELQEGRLRYKRSLQPSKKNIQPLKALIFSIFFFYICGLFLPSWVRFSFIVPIANPDPDEAEQNQCGSIRIQVHNTAIKLINQSMVCRIFILYNCKLFIIHRIKFISVCSSVVDPHVFGSGTLWQGWIRTHL